MIKHTLGFGLSRPKQTIRSFAAGSSLLLSTLTLIGQTTTAPNSSQPAPAKDEPLVLSPFVVDASQDSGYRAQNTLSGTRLNSSVADLGSTMTILTPEAWGDLGAVNTNDLMLYTPGGDVRNGNYSDSNSGNLFWGDSTVFRGIATENIVRNYFRSEIPSDVYNTGRMEFVRGANAVLFGVAGDPNGLVNRATQDANLNKDSYVYTSQVDNFGSVRNSINSNYVLLKDKLAVRVALLDADQNTWLKPINFQDQQRVYVAAQYQPIKNLSIKVNYEHFDWLRAAGSGTISFDSVTPWINAGRPGVPTGAVNTNVTPWLRGYANNSARIMGVYDGSSTGPVLQDWNNKALGANNAIVGSTNISLPVPFMDRRFDVNGQAATQKLGGADVNVFVDYALTKDLNFNLAINDESVDYDFISAGGNGRLNVDATTNLPSGAPNPNFGRYFTISEPGFRLKQERFRRDRRFTMSYHLDFAKFDRMRWLGVHDFAGMFEQDVQEQYWDVLNLRNKTPLPGSSPLIGHINNRVNFVNYVDIANNTIYGGGLSSLDWEAEANKLPGVSAAWLPSGGPSNIKTVLNSQLYVVQSRFWDKRLVTTVGWRQDAINAQSLDPTSIVPLYPTGAGAGFNNYARTTKRKQDPSATPTNWSKSAVFHVVRNKGIVDDLSLSWSTSTSFAVSNFNVMPDRSDFPAKTGSTKDIGLKAELFNRRVGLSLIKFDAAVENLGLQISAVTTRMSDLFELIGKTEYVNVPQVADRQDKTSKGYEFQFTTNITPNWRLMGSVSTYETLNQNTALTTGQIIDKYKSQWLANPNALVPNRGTETAQRTFDDMVFQYQIVRAQEGQRSLLERKYKYVGITNYTFTEGPLKGFSVGGNVVWQSAGTTGYGLKPVVNATTGATTYVPDAANQFKGSTLMNVGVSAGYGRKIFRDRVRWDVQLNVRNLIGVDPYVIRTSAASTAPTVAIPLSIYRGDPTTYILTNTFKF